MTRFLRTVLLAAGAICPAGGQVSAEASRLDPQALERYAVHCSPCHGARGRGDGPAARFLDPKPRDFTAGRFKFVGSATGRPAREDVIRAIEHGLPGTSMLGFRALGPEAISSLAGVVDAFRSDGLASQLREDAESPEQLREWIDQEMRPPPLVVPRIPAALDPAAAARGGLSFATLCASCHALDGSAAVPLPPLEDGSPPERPRDLTRSPLKGGGEPLDLFRRIRCGIPGTSMPAVPDAVLDDRGVWDLVAFLQSIIPEGARRARPLTGPALAPASIAPPCPTGVDDPRIAQLPAVAVPLAPFRSDVDHARELLVQSATDGTHLIFRVRYADGTMDPGPKSVAGSPDGVAVRVAAGEFPPVLPIPGQPLPLDRALWLSGTMPDERDPLFLALDPPFENPDSVCKSPIGPQRTGDGRWRDRVWTVLVPIRPERAGPLPAQGPRSVSFSVFDGAHAKGPLPVAFTPWCPIP